MGEVTKWRQDCERLRKPDGKCGPDAIGWEQRPQKEEKKSKMERFWNWLQDTF